MPVGKRPKTRTPENVPGKNDPDRKRVLNVLAQRRYRQRKKEKIAALENLARRLSPTESTEESEGSAPRDPERAPDIVCSSYLGDLDMIENFMQQDRAGLDASDFCNSSNPTVATAFSSENIEPWTLTPPRSDATAFPLTADSAMFEMPLLSVIRAFTTISTKLNIVDHIWNPHYLHVLPPRAPLDLPANLHPTPAQLMIPHHPLIDTLPWPAVRDKLICVLSIPFAFRPPIARDDDGEGQGKIAMKLAQDLDDIRDGVRVHGNLVGWEESNELVEEAWEIGELCYRNWWWCLDEKPIAISNQRRRERGLGALRLKA